MRLAATLLMALATASPSPQPSASPAPSASPSTRSAPLPTAQEPPERRRVGQLANVRLDINVTERRGAAPPLTKLVSMTVADREQGKIRSMAEIPPGAGVNFPIAVPLHVDARPTIDGTRVHLRISLDYTAERSTDASVRSPVLNVKEDLSVILENGRPMTIADAGDPLGDRRVQVEVTATILR